MVDAEYERWEGRFAVADYIFGKAPNYFLVACKPLLPRSGKALAIADGEGRNGVWLAEQGLDVVSVDFSPAAQRNATARAWASPSGVSGWSLWTISVPPTLPVDWPWRTR